MRVVYALQPLTKSIFLVGPTPRDDDTPTWRPEALRILKELGYDGTVFVPESADWAKHSHYDAQVNWEWAALDQSMVVACWIPREIRTMPAFTSNVEVGLVFPTGKALLGYPPGTPKMGYLHALADRFHVPVFHDLRLLLQAAVERANTVQAGATRPGNDGGWLETRIERLSGIMGGRDAALTWLSTPAMGLNRQKPEDLIGTPEGRNEVDTLITRIEHGVYT